MSHEPNCLEIDLSAITHNLRQIKNMAGNHSKIMGIIKSDAYGHGLLPGAQALVKNNVDCLGVAYLHEALELRKDGIGLPIIILCGILTRDEAAETVEKDLTPVVFDITIAEILDQESAKRGKKTHIHMNVDTGMGRLGIPYDETGPFIRKIAVLKNLDLDALTSHLSAADEISPDFTELQIKRFKEAIQTGRSMGVALPFNNLANSAGIMAHKNAIFEMVRPGIMLYGGLPSPGFVSPVSLKPAMQFKGRIIQIRDLPAQTPVSYGRTYLTKGPCQMAVLSAGYGNGLPRNLSNRGNVLIKGKKFPLVGRVCMNLCICDITGLNQVTTGEDAVFIGSQGNKTIRGDDLARWADTISYEVFCSIGQRNKRKYL